MVSHRHETRIVGRAAKFEVIRERLEADDVRVLTLRGPGGVGKTTLARELVRDGTAPFVELDVCDTVDDIVAAVGEGLEVPDVARSAEGIGETLTDEEIPLVVLDNAEHVVDELAHLLGEWLDASSTTFVVTSRERLRVGGEALIDVAPLDPADARKLFVLRAREVVPDFEVDESNEGDVDELVRMLDGLPLAVELAASRVRILSPAQIRERLDEQFELLKNDRGEVDRHATLDACVEWSWEMLGERQRDVLIQCAIFRGRFTIDDAEQVVETDGWVGESLDELVERSLIWVDRDIEIRFSLYDSVRRFVERRVEFDDALLERYLEVLLQRATDRVLTHQDLVNVVHAIDLGLERAPELSIDLLAEARQRLWRGGFLTRLIGMLQRALALPDLPPVREGRLWASVASTRYAQMEYEECDKALDRASELVGDSSTDEARAVKTRVAMMRGIRANETHRVDEAARQFEIARSSLDAVPAHERAHVLAASGLAALRRREFDQGIVSFDQAIEAARKCGEVALLARTLSWSSLGYLALANHERAIDRLEESLELFAQCEDVVSLTQAQYTLAQALIEKDPERALEVGRMAVRSSNLGRLRVLQATTRVLVARLEGDAEATSTIRRALRVFGEDSAHNDRWSVWLSLVVVLVRRGELDLAARELRELIRTVERVGTDEEAKLCRRYLSAVECLRGSDEFGAIADDEFAEAVRRTAEAGEASPDDLDRFRDPYMQLQHDFSPEPLELFEDGLAAKRDIRTLTFADDGGTALLPDGEEIDLESRYVLRRLMHALCEAHDERPGETMTLEELVEAGWPDETMTYESGIRRVYSAIRNLRKLGFEDILLTGENGYLIDPDLDIVYR